jgi:cell division protein DivIC
MNLKKYIKPFKNKYILTGTLFVLYSLLLDDNDIFSIVNHQNKLRKIEQAKVDVSAKLKNTKFLLNQLHFTPELEKYAREEKYFKKDDEDIFVITYE